MKKILAFLSTAVLFLLGSSVALAVPPTPSQCTGMVFDNVIVSTTWGDSVTGTSGRDLIFVNGGTSVQSLGGADCISTSLGGNDINAGAGNDVIVVNGSGNFVNGGTGYNLCYGLDSTSGSVNCN